MKFDPSEAGGKATYFRMTECIVPRPIAWVSSLDAQGVPNLAPFSFFTGVTSSPPTLLFCCGNRRDGRPKDTAANIMATGEFVVNIARSVQAHDMVQTSASYPTGTSEFEAVGLARKPSDRVAPPRVESAPIAFECIREAIHEVSNDSGVVTSRIIIGRIVLIHIDDDVLDSDGRVCSETLDTVSRIGGHLYAPIGSPYKIPRPR